MKNHEWQYVPIKDPITLLTESAVFLPKYADFKGFEFVKLDSISFIAAKPLFDGLDTQIAKAHVICKNEEFKITAERSTDGSNYPNLLYHSPPIAYSKMGDMLGCEGMLIS